MADVKDGTERFYLASFQEACRAVEEGVAQVKDVDLALRAGAGFREGIFERADRIGLDVIKERLEALAKTSGERFAPRPILLQKVSQGHLGAKTGRGFLDA